MREWQSEVLVYGRCIDMLYSDVGNIKLHVAAINPQVTPPGMPRRTILTVNHVTSWADYSARIPDEQSFSKYTDWRIVGDKRTWKPAFVQQIAKPTTKADPGQRLTSFLVILEQVITNPEKEVVAAPPGDEVKYLRRFSNLLLDDGV